MLDQIMNSISSDVYYAHERRKEVLSLGERVKVDHSHCKEGKVTKVMDETKGGTLYEIECIAGNK